MEFKVYCDGVRVSSRDCNTLGGEIDLFCEMTGGSEEEGGDAGKNNDAITLKVRDQAGDVMFFKVKKSTEMKKIFEAYAQRLGVNVKHLKFTLDGERLKEADTPKMLELNDEDQIDVFLEQVGGAEEESKPSGDDLIITLKVRDASGEEIAFKVKKSTKMTKIFEAYATRKGVQLNAVRFNTEDGARVNGEHTPKMLELTNDSVLDAMVEQQGGF